jgi:hypothetical protein
MSHASKKNQALKIHGITKLKTDIILLSDTRLSNKNLVLAANDIKKPLVLILISNTSSFTIQQKTREVPVY